MTNATPLAVLTCPTRRSVKAYPAKPSTYPLNAAASTIVAKTDYGANAGDGPWLSDVGEPTGIGISPKNADTAETGVIYQCSVTKAADITDGLSNTYLLGEKYINSDNYATGLDDGDDQSAYVGYDFDTCRWTHSGSVAPWGNLPTGSLEGTDIGVPLQDIPGVEQVYNFGSAIRPHAISPSATVRPRNLVLDQRRSPSPLWQPQGRPADRRQAVLGVPEPAGILWEAYHARLSSRQSHQRMPGISDHPP